MIQSTVVVAVVNRFESAYIEFDSLFVHFSENLFVSDLFIEAEGEKLCHTMLYMSFKL